MASILEKLSSGRVLGLDDPRLTPTLAVLGALALGFTGIWMFDFITVYLKPSKIRKYVYTSKDGKPAWALVTGASDGIGKALCRELAGHGYNVVLHGRNPDKLGKVVADLKRDFPAREFKTAIVDASTLIKGVDGLSSLDTIVKLVADLHLTVLINNAGTAAYPPEPVYTTVPETKDITIMQTISTNAVFPTVLLGRLLPQLSQVKGPTIVLSLSSLADNALPFISIYAASKTFTASVLATAGRELQAEPGNQVDVLNLRIGHVTGVTHNRQAGTLFYPDSVPVAKACLARVGCGRTNVVAWWPHALQDMLVNLMPESVKGKLFIDIMTGLKNDEIAEIQKRDEQR
jgi:17beta-estradiol 17-dehydrogenase / very-long-chain 3-oxoacyl-CoA reductase